MDTSLGCVSIKSQSLLTVCGVYTTLMIGYILLMRSM